MDKLLDLLKFWKNEVALLVVFIFLSYVALSRFRKAGVPTLLGDDKSNVYEGIEPLEDFHWQDVDHVKLRPFKPSYYLTMGVQNVTMSDLVLMDNTYLEKIKLRREIIDTHEVNVIACNPVARDAVFELYEYLFETYLPKRFPSMFVIEEINKGSLRQRQTRNMVLGDTVPIQPPPSNPRECLVTIGRHVDCEFALLLPESNPKAKPFRVMPTNEPKQPYHLQAYSLVFPSGFNTPAKLGLPLAAIHAPVPGYSQKLEKSMDRYFANMPFGKLIFRANWSVSTDGVYFKLAGLHTDIRHSQDEEVQKATESKIEMAAPTYEATEEELAQWREESKKIIPEKCHLRMERQTLHRLEKTGALVFGFKTFMEPLSELKKEGSGPAFAAALEGLRVGNAPAMDVYKNGVIWREPLVKYLTS